MTPHFHKHIRLPGHDYTKGKYFVTICARERANIFGAIVIAKGSDKSTLWVDAAAGRTDDQRMELNYAGLVDECWRAIPDHFPNAHFDQMQIMPDHLHGIIVWVPPMMIAFVRSTQWVDATGASENDRVIPRGPVPDSLGVIIGHSNRKRPNASTG